MFAIILMITGSVILLITRSAFNLFKSDLSMIIMIIVMMTGTVIALITCSASNLVATFQGRCPTLDEAITNERQILDIFN